MRAVTALRHSGTSRLPKRREEGYHMKRVYAFAIGLAMMVAPMATATGLASADPSTRPMDYQQATDTVIARGLSQRGDDQAKRKNGPTYSDSSVLRRLRARPS